MLRDSVLQSEVSGCNSRLRLLIRDIITQFETIVKYFLYYTDFCVNLTSRVRHL